MKKRLNGRCLCGDVTYSVREDFDAFYLCHCEQCQKVTGSAFAANIITAADNIEWHSGAHNISRYQDARRDFTKAFCVNCGAGVPHINRNGTHLIIPAGSLTDSPADLPSANLFRKEGPSWLANGLPSKSFKGFPT